MIVKTLITLVFLCASLPIRVIGFTGISMEGSSEPSAVTAAQPGNPVIQWNRTLLEILRTPGAQPPTVHPTRSLAIMHAAIYDAVNAIDRTHSPYLVDIKVSRQVSQAAAAAAAAHRVLIELYPERQEMLDARLAQSLAQIPEGRRKRLGLRLGRIVAQRLLALRSDDGSDARPIPYEPGKGPGDYQLTPPNFVQPVFTHWPQVTPFTLTSADQFCPGPPPELTSDTYMAALREVKELGDINSATRSADQTEIARFWVAPIQNYWNEIAQTAALAQDLTPAQSARLFALLNLTFADSVIAFYDAKYTYHFWRPVTAIRAADPDWLPLTTTTPADPSYPGAHSVISAGGAAVLSAFFGHDDVRFIVRSEALPGVERSFTSFTAAVEEVGLSRIYAGVHFRFDHTSAQQLGGDIADYVLQNFLVPRRLERESDDR
jgi:hypothetical protein